MDSQPPPFRRIPLLDVEETESVYRKILELTGTWTAVGEAGSSFTLGTASYLAGDDYEDRAAQTNGTLRETFGWLYERLSSALFPVLGEVHEAPVAFEPKFGLPGFQIIVVGDEMQDPRGILGGAHWDWNFLSLAWEPPLGDAFELDAFASFTLPIVLPRAGSGLRVWETLTSAEVSAYADEKGLRQWDAIAELVKAGYEPSFHPYKTGELIVHSGHLVHQVPPWQCARGDERITLQGHALLHEGRWRIYW
jgi:hypothetical protein